MRARSVTGSSVEQIGEALTQLSAADFHASLAIVFISISQDRAALGRLLQEQGIDVIGATSAGEFIDGHQGEGEIVILLLDIDKAYYRILFMETAGKDVAEAGREVTATAKTIFPHPAFILCSTGLGTNGVMFEGERLIHSIREAAGPAASVFGGMAGDDTTLTGTYIFSGQQTTDEGFAVLVFDNDQILLTGMAISGWKPVGKTRTVTRAADGWLYTIDDQPALDMYLRYLGQSMQTGDDLQKSHFAEDIGFFHPFLSIDSGEPVLRTPLEVNKETGAIKLDFPIPEGNQFLFTLPPDFDIVETVLAEASALKTRENATADALLIFSCLSRLSALGPMVHEENEGLFRIWNAPMAGFFSYGEYGKDLNSEHSFHSTTCSWVALKEKG